MDLEILWKAIVPLAFLAIWALTALFNRDAKPLPPRAQGSPNPYGPRPIPPSPAMRPPEPIRAAPPLRWAPRSANPAASGPGGDDDIVILDSSRATRVPPARTPPPARKSRPKPQAPAAPKPTPSVQPKQGLSGVSQTVNQQLTSSASLTPLWQNEGPASVASVASTSAQPMTSTNPMLRTLAIAAALRDPARVREAFLISELLLPPVTLRKRRR